MSVHVIDYGVCNLGSVRRAFEECGADVVLNTNPDSLEDADRIVLPGVGAYSDAMSSLQNKNWPEAIRRAVLEKKIPILGICLGMQLFATTGEEGGGCSGLNLISGEVKKIIPDNATLRVPHVGWNEITRAKESAVLQDIKDGSDFYFVHSFHFVPDRVEDVLLKTPYGGDVVAAVEVDHIIGVQFHPEKSGRAGFQIIRNFLRV